MKKFEKDRKHFRIGEVSRMLDIPSYVLRFWESEFPELEPVKTSKGQRLYTRENIEIIQKIMHLRYQEKMTLPGAKQRLKAMLQQDNPEPKTDRNAEKMLREIKKGLQEILSDLR